MLPVNVAVHDIELGERSQHGVRTAGMAVVGRAGDGSFHAEILLQIPAHVPIELTFRIHVESHFGGVEMREDKKEEYCHLVTLWKATKEEQQLYEEHS